MKTRSPPKFTLTLWTADWKKPSNGFSPPSSHQNLKRSLIGPLTHCTFGGTHQTWKYRLMIKKLTKHGNSLALMIDKSILDQIGADADTRFEISTNGQALILTPVWGAGRGESFKAALDDVNARYPKTLKKLAE